MRVAATCVRPSLRVLAASAAVAVLSSCGGGDRSFDDELTATVSCNESSATLVYEPDSTVEVRVGDEAVAWATGHGRGIDPGVCEQVETQRESFVGIRYATLRKATTLSCRVPGQLFVHVSSVHGKTHGEEEPDGSTVSITFGVRPTIAASAGVDERSETSTLSFSRRYCKPAADEAAAD